MKHGLYLSLKELRLLKRSLSFAMDRKLVIYNDKGVNLSEKLETQLINFINNCEQIEGDNETKTRF